MCSIEDCDRPLNRDELCFYHKMHTLRFSVNNLRVERNGGDVTGGRGTREYVRSMYERRRANGLPDPVATTKEAAAFAPAIGVAGGKKYRAANGGI